jgi:hypothetical protein
MSVLVEVELREEATAWAVPERLGRGQVELAVVPWTRVADFVGLRLQRGDLCDRRSAAPRCAQPLRAR